MCAVLIALGQGAALLDRFVDALPVVNAGRRRHAGRTYQGFIKAMKQSAATLLPQVEEHLREAIYTNAGPCWELMGWPTFAVDGSKIDCPKTAANESAFRIGGRKKSGPQQLITTLWHMGTGLPWSWMAGRADASEREQLQSMLPLIPSGALLVMDAGFTGFDLLWKLQSANLFFLLRVGANVTLLRNLGYVEERGNTVYLWPEERKDRQPMVLRLVTVRPPHGRPIYLVTNVLDESALNDEAAGVMYRMRWGVEVFYRSFKQTLERRKMRSAAPRQAELELRWSMIGLLLLGLMSVSAMIKSGRDPLRWSVAGALRLVRQAMRQTKTTAVRLLQSLASAVRDTYFRLHTKKARDWAHKKKETPPGEPKLRDATPAQIRAAQEVTVTAVTR